MKVREGELEVSFEGCEVDELDTRHEGKRRPQGMRFVDWVVERPGAPVWLVEVTDPCATGATQEERGKFVESLRGKTLVEQELVPKARDSYCYLHLMERGTEEVVFVVLIGSEALQLDPGLWGPKSTELEAALLKEGYEPWKRKYVNQAIVVGSTEWAKHFPQYELARVAGGQA